MDFFSREEREERTKRREADIPCSRDMERWHHKETWHGKYRSVGWEIDANHWEDQRYPGWCFYLYLHHDRMPEGELKQKALLAPYNCTYTHNGELRVSKTIGHDYTNCWLAGLPWHCGMTYYERFTNDYGQWIKAGCDYSHLWDEKSRAYYNVNFLLADVKHCIEEFLIIMPEYEEKKDDA